MQFYLFHVQNSSRFRLNVYFRFKSFEILFSEGLGKVRSIHFSDLKLDDHFPILHWFYDGFLTWWFSGWSNQRFQIIHIHSDDQFRHNQLLFHALKSDIVLLWHELIFNGYKKAGAQGLR